MVNLDMNEHVRVSSEGGGGCWSLNCRSTFVATLLLLDTNESHELRGYL